MSKTQQSFPFPKTSAKRTSNRPTVPRGAPPPSVPESLSVGAGSLDYFAASFLASVERHDVGDWTKYSSDPRVGAIVGAIKGGLLLEKVGDILGSGSFGLAAALGEGGVIKLTSDPTEVQVGAVLRGKTLPHVVPIYGAWFIRGTEVDTKIGWDPDTEEDLRQMMKVGLLIEARVEPLDAGEARVISRIVNKVKDDEEAYPADLFSLSPGKARAKLRHVSEVLEAAMRAHSRTRVTRWNIAGDIASAIAELRDVGVYAIDTHGGNVGFDEESQTYKLFDIGSSSAPKRPAPGELRADARPSGKIKLPLPYVQEGVAVGELG